MKIAHLVIAIALLASPVDALAENLTGIPYITDGDTVTIAGQRIRLLGIDAPEMEQVCLDAKGADWRCGVAARDAITAAWAGKDWRCELREDRDRYGRRLGTCYVGDVDIDRWMVRGGWALSYRHYSHVYDGDEDAARAERKGVWSGALDAPWDWRHGVCEIRGTASATDARERLCR